MSFEISAVTKGLGHIETVKIETPHPVVAETPSFLTKAASSIKEAIAGIGLPSNLKIEPPGSTIFKGSEYNASAPSLTEQFTALKASVSNTADGFTSFFKSPAKLDPTHTAWSNQILAGGSQKAFYDPILDSVKKLGNQISEIKSPLSNLSNPLSNTAIGDWAENWKNNLVNTAHNNFVADKAMAGSTRAQIEASEFLPSVLKQPFTLLNGIAEVGGTALLTPVTGLAKLPLDALQFAGNQTFDFVSAAAKPISGFFSAKTKPVADPGLEDAVHRTAEAAAAPDLHSTPNGKIFFQEGKITQLDMVHPSTLLDSAVSSLAGSMPRMKPAYEKDIDSLLQKTLGVKGNDYPRVALTDKVVSTPADVNALVDQMSNIKISWHFEGRELPGPVEQLRAKLEKGESIVRGTAPNGNLIVGVDGSYYPMRNGVPQVVPQGFVISPKMLPVLQEALMGGDISFNTSPIDATSASLDARYSNSNLSA